MALATVCRGAESICKPGVAGAAEGDDTSSGASTDWPFELDGGPGGSDIAGALRREIGRLADNESGSDEESSDPVSTVHPYLYLVGDHLQVQVGTVSRDAKVGTLSRHAGVAAEAEHERYDQQQHD